MKRVIYKIRGRRFDVGHNWATNVRRALYIDKNARINGTPVWGMPDCNLPKRERTNYCVTNALGYLLGTIPSSFDDKLNSLEEADEAVTSYQTFAQ